MAMDQQGIATKNLQRYLRTLSYFDDRIPEVPIDGIFDEATEKGVRAFQEIAGLSPTGRVDAKTWQALYRAYLAERARRDAPARISHFPRLPENYTVELGEQQFLVQIIQHALAELDTVYDWPSVPEITGIYDEPTAAVVRIFQEKNGLPTTGGVDRATWNALADAYNRRFAAYSKE